MSFGASPREDFEEGEVQPDVHRYSPSDSRGPPDRDRDRGVRQQLPREVLRMLSDARVLRDPSRGAEMIMRELQRTGHTGWLSDYQREYDSLLRWANSLEGRAGERDRNWERDRPPRIDRARSPDQDRGRLDDRYRRPVRGGGWDRDGPSDWARWPRDGRPGVGAPPIDGGGVGAGSGGRDARFIPRPRPGDSPSLTGSPPAMRPTRPSIGSPPSRGAQWPPSSRIDDEWRRGARDLPAGNDPGRRRRDSIDGRLSDRGTVPGQVWRPRSPCRPTTPTQGEPLVPRGSSAPPTTTSPPPEAREGKRCVAADGSAGKREASAEEQLAAELDGLSVGRVVGALEELERAERTLAEQIRGMTHDVEDKRRLLTRCRHADERQAAKAAARLERARLSMEERERIAATALAFRARRRNMLAHPFGETEHELVSPYARAVESVRAGGGAPALWTMFVSAGSLSATADVLAANRRTAAAACEAVGLPCLASPPADTPSAGFLRLLSAPSCTAAASWTVTLSPARPPVLAAAVALPLVDEMAVSTRLAVMALLHRDRRASRARLLALGAAYSLAVDEWNAKERAKEDGGQRGPGGGRGIARNGSSSSIKADGEDADGQGAAGKTRNARKRMAGSSWDSPVTGDVLRSDWALQQVLTELELEARKQRSREATAAKVPDMLPSEVIAAARFDVCSNSLCSTDGEPPACVDVEPTEACAGALGCNCVVACDQLRDLVNPWSDLEKLIFMDKFMQFPKDFVKISKFLVNKSPQECAEFYYLTKHVVGYKQKLKKQSLAARRRAPRNGWLLARQGAQAIGVVVPKPLMDGGNEPGVANVVPVTQFVADAQFSVTTIPVAPMHPPKALVDPTKKKKKKEEGKPAAAQTPVPTASPRPPPPPVTTPRAPVPLQAGPPRPTGLAKPLPTTRSAPVPAPRPPLPLRPTGVMSKELASLLGTPVQRVSMASRQAAPAAAAAVPVLPPSPAADASANDKKRKREEDMAPMAKWSQSERDEFVRLFKIHGREWTDIANQIPTKTAAQVKNFFQNNKKVLNLEDPPGKP